MAHVEGGSKEWGSLRGLRIDDCGRRELALCMLLSDPLLNFLEDVSHVEGQMVRRCRHHRDLCPALRELPLKDGQRQLGSDFGLPGEDRDHSRFMATKSGFAVGRAQTFSHDAIRHTPMTQSGQHGSQETSLERKISWPKLLCMVCRV